MRPSPKPSICVAAISVGLLLIICNSGGAEEPQKAQPTIKELQEKRLALLVHISEAAKKLFENGRGEYVAFHTAERELFAARLEYAETKADRIKACDQAIAEARQAQRIIQEQEKAGRGSGIGLMKAQEFELQAQIERMRLEASK
ncbi:MAG TPA: hypothetical protein VHD36_03850 [Pirellulales bacterium]|nr:hypothetical protein [Pirellulales bacterium]